MPPSRSSVTMTADPSGLSEYESGPPGRQLQLRRHDAEAFDDLPDLRVLVAIEVDAVERRQRLRCRVELDVADAAGELRGARQGIAG